MALVLVGALCLGVRQYALYRDHEQVNAQNEKIIFQFAIIREHVTEALLEKSYNRLSGVAAEIEKLNINLSQILANRSIADEYKIGIVNAIDLPGIILLLRKLEGGEADPEIPRRLNGDMRTLGERLMLFDRVLVNLAKGKLVGFQNIVIGMLSLVVFLLTVLMLMFNRRIINPLLGLNVQAKELMDGSRKKIVLPVAAPEIADLAAHFTAQDDESRKAADDAGRLLQVTEAVIRTHQAICQSKNRSAFFKEVCRALLTNENYCLVWLGLLDENGRDLLPVSADGSTTMNSKECEICMTVLLTDAEEKGVERNPAADALRKGSPVVHRDILADIPKGLLKGTPLAAGYAACAALPLSWQDKVYGVLSIYSTSEEGFQPREMDVLGTAALTISLALSLYRGQDEKLRSAEVLEASLHIVKGGLLCISPEGIIGESLRLPEQFGCRENPAGKEWQRVLQPVDGERFAGKDGAALLAELSNSGPVEMLLHCGEVRRAVLCRFSRAAQHAEGAPGYNCLVWDGSAGLLMSAKNGGVCSSQLAALGELATGMAHEIGDLNNGMINYAQALADELNVETLPPEQRYMVDRILAGGERVAAIVKKFSYYGQEKEKSSEFRPVQQVLADALELYGNQLKSDGIHVDYHGAAALPGVQVKAQKMFVVFLQLLSNARRALNSRYPQRDAGKRLDIHCEVVGDEKHQQAVVVLTDHGYGMHQDDLPGIFEPDFTARPGGAGGRQSLALCREVVQKHGGIISVACASENVTAVRLCFPLSS